MTDTSSMSKAQLDAFTKGFLTVPEGQIAVIEYPEGVTNSHHLKIVARGFDHPKIAAPAFVDGILNTASNIASDVIEATGISETVDKYSEKAKSAFTEYKKKIEDLLNVTGRYKGKFFEFKTYIPGSLENSVSASWENFATDRTRDMMNNVMSGASSFLGGKFKGIGNKLTGGDILGYGLYKAGKGQIPAETAIFKSTSSSGIDIMIRFAPRNKTEANVMLDTIRLFRNGTRPSINDSNTFFDYPPIYDITLCPKRSTEAVVKSAYQKFPPMYLSNSRVTYSDGLPLSSFFSDGNPTEATLRLTFEPIVVNFNGAEFERGTKLG